MPEFRAVAITGFPAAMASNKALGKPSQSEGRMKSSEEVSTSLNKSQYAYSTLKKDSADYLKIKAAYDNIKNRTDVLGRENEVLKSAQTNKWFATGALVLLCGLMIGVVIGRQQKKRRSSLYV